MRSSFAASSTRKTPAAPGVHENEPDPRRKVATRVKASPPFLNTLTSTADSFDTVKRISAGWPRTARAGPSRVRVGGSTW